MQAGRCPAEAASSRIRSSIPRSSPASSIVLDASGSLTSFAGEYLRTHTVGEDAQVSSGRCSTSSRCFCPSGRSSRGVADWLSNRDWIASRLQQEILTLKFGVARGDEIELQRDPVVQTALKKLRGAP